MEKWCDIPGYKGCYQASTAGRVRSLDRVVMRSDGQKRRYKGQLLKPGKRPSGHVTVALGRNNSLSVHTLIMRAFVGAPPNNHEVLHKNHIPADNRLSNLKYGTRSENIKMDFAAGNRQPPNNWRWL